MPDRMRFVVPLLIVLAVLSWAATEILIRTSRQSLEHDVDMRARLAVASAERDLVRTWRVHDAGSIAWLLGQIARDERIMSAAACAPDLACGATANTPESRSAACARAPRAPVRRRAGARLDAVERGHHARSGRSTSQRTRSSTTAAARLGGAGAGPGFIDRRETHMRAVRVRWHSAVLALSASIFTLVVGARRRGAAGTIELRHALRGRHPTPRVPAAAARRARAGRSSSPRERDARRPVDRRAAQAHAAAATSTASSLVIVANREPYIHEKDADGAARRAPGQRAGHRARAGDARLLAACGSRTAAARPTARRRRARAACGCRPAKSRTRSAASG